MGRVSAFIRSLLFFKTRLKQDIPNVGLRVIKARHATVSVLETFLSISVGLLEGVVGLLQALLPKDYERIMHCTLCEEIFTFTTFFVSCLFLVLVLLHFYRITKKCPIRYIILRLCLVRL